LPNPASYQSHAGKWILLDQRLEVAKQNVRDRETGLIIRNAPNDVRAELLRADTAICMIA